MVLPEWQGQRRFVRRNDTPLRSNSFMEKQEVKSKWDELAREIGAEISPEREQLVEAVTPPAEAEANIAPKPRTSARPPAPKRPAGWDNLASEFGLPVAEPVVEEVVEEPAV